ncbi:ParB/RepB/Spo0J family partition protein [Streptacidiphilus carbonis]|uniref:ParB/RepB/Spo0J family partition protein n=1 Tax=Streptacidiphilus carbonis TaxID=105422 RepID=UPI000695007C|nr:ParB/RepB/Spo0J family partition protein [Streptacidiphilus carbonis]
MSARRVNLADMLDGEPLDEPTEAARRHPDIHLTLDELAFNPENPREVIDHTDPEFRELLGSVTEIGVIAPVTVCTVTAFLKHHPQHTDTLTGAGYVVVAGHRRIEASRLAGRDRIPAMVNDAAAVDPLMWAIAENMLRVDLNPMEQARALRVLTDKPPAGKGVSQRKVAAGIGKTQAFVSQRIALLSLHPDLQTKVATGTLGVKAARDYAALPLEQQLDAHERDLHKPTAATPPQPSVLAPPPTETAPPGDNPVINQSAEADPGSVEKSATGAPGDNRVITYPPEPVRGRSVPEPRTGLAPVSVGAAVGEWLTSTPTQDIAQALIERLSLQGLLDLAGVLHGVATNMRRTNQLDAE